MDRKTLHLTLNKKWFDMILSGKKKEEYREIKEFYIPRFMVQEDVNAHSYKWWLNKMGNDPYMAVCGMMHDEYSVRDYNKVTFRNGYGLHVPEVTLEVKGVEIRGGHQEWGAIEGSTYFCTLLGDVLSTNNLK